MVRARSARKILGRLLWPNARDQIEFNQAITRAVRALSEDVNDLVQRADFFQRAIDNFENAFDNVDEAFRGIESRAEVLGERLDLFGRQAFIRYQEGIGALQRELANFSLRVEEQLSSENRENAETQEAFAARLRTFESGLADLRLRVGQVDLFLNEVKRSLPDTPTAERLASLPDAIANLYPSFEEVLRGPESVIKERARSYLGDIEATPVGGAVLDLACGRGEWLEVLRDADIQAYGVEINEQYIARGTSRGLDIRKGDALEHLKGLPDSELRAISAIHFIEHLESGQLVEMLDLALRALRPGGLIILETPDPENLLVGASSFYLDPTHLHPIPPQLLLFLVNARGFTDVSVREFKRTDRLESKVPVAAPWREDVNAIWEFLQNRVAGPEDFAVLARRA